MYFETSYHVQNTARRYDDGLLHSCHFNNNERFLFCSLVRHVNYFALKEVTTVQIHQYFRRIGNVDIKNSEAHTSILELHKARFYARHTGRAAFEQGKPRAIIGARPRPGKKESVQKFERIAEENAKSAIQNKKRFSGSQERYRQKISALAVSDIIQMMPAYLAVDTSRCKPKQPRGLRLVPVLSAERGSQQDPLAISQRSREIPAMSVQQAD
jgi:hypothetical protein